MKLKFKAGSTGRTAKIFVQDTSKTDGSGLTGLTNASSGLTWYWIREGDASATSVSIVSATLGTFTSGGFIVVDGTNMPGIFEIGFPNASIAAGAKTVHMMLRGATNMAPVLIEIELDAVDYQDAAAFGLSRLDVATGTRMISYTQPTGFLAATFPATIASTTNITAGTITTAGTVTDKAGYSLSGTQSFNNTGQTAKLAATLAATDVTGNVPADIQTIKTQAVTATAGFSYDAQTAAQGTISTNLNATISSRLASGSYTAPDNADIVTALTDMVSLLGRTDPTMALAAVKAVTDVLSPMIVAGQFTVPALANAPGGTGSDPLANLPTHYGPGEIGALIANLDISVSSVRGTGSGLNVCTLGPFSDSATGQPLAGATVWVTRDAIGQQMEVSPTLTDAAGTVKTTLADGASYYLFFIKAGETPIVGQLFTAHKD